MDFDGVAYGPAPMVRVSLERFEELVADALDSIPPELGDASRTSRWSSRSGRRPSSSTDGGGTLLGLYEGVPLTER